MVEVAMEEEEDEAVAAMGVAVDLVEDTTLEEVVVVEEDEAVALMEVVVDQLEVVMESNILKQVKMTITLCTYETYCSSINCQNYKDLLILLRNTRDINTYFPVL